MRAIVRLGFDATGLFHVAICETASWCSWRSPAHAVKAGATEEARWHREEHKRCRDLAETSTRHGWYRQTNIASWVPCPSCRHHVKVAHVASLRDREIAKLLVDAVEEHLMNRDECGGPRR